MRPWGVVALGLMMASAPALAQELSYGPSVPQWLLPDPFAGARASPVPMPPRRTASSALALAPPPPRGILDELIAAHARLNDVPEALVHRVIKRESRYDPRAVGQHGAMGLMQIKHATARALGYTGPAAGLLDPETNLTYAVRYLAGALRAANGDPERGYALYRSGYYTSRRGARLARARHGAAPSRPDADIWGLHGTQ
jgi:soluble lytic murein transglycosylase-like protein